MGIFDLVQNLLGGVTDNVQGSIGDAVSGLTDNQIVQDVQEQATVVTDGVTEATNSVAEQGQTIIDTATQSLEP